MRHLLGIKRSRAGFKEISRRSMLCVKAQGWKEGENEEFANHLSVQQLFLPSQLCFFPYLLEVGLHCFGLGSEEVRRLLSVFNVRYKL